MGGDRRPWLGRLAIIGGAARGLVYVIAGGRLRLHRALIPSNPVIP